MIGREFAKAKIPTGVQVCEKQLFHYVDRMENVEIDHEIESFLPVIYRKLEWMTKEDMIKRFVSLEFNRFLEYYRDAKDLNVEEDKRSEREPSEGRSRRDGGREFGRDSGREGGRGKIKVERPDKDFTRMFVSVGRKDRILPQQIIGLINEVTRSREIRVGRIDILDSYSFVDIDTNAVPKVLKAFAEGRNNPEGVRIEKASEKDEASSSPRRSRQDDDRPRSRDNDRPRFRDESKPDRNKKTYKDKPSFESPWNRSPRKSDPRKGRRK
jgi:ATP-dependent RNA helicase DeaD